MPNITIKKSDGTTDVLWTQVQPGGSDPARPAIWQSYTVGVAQSHKPEFRFYVRRADGMKNEVVMTGHYPVLSTNTTTGLTSVVARQRLKVVFEFDNAYAQTDINEAVAQFINLMDSTTLYDAIRLQVAVLT